MAPDKAEAEREARRNAHAQRPPDKAEAEREARRLHDREAYAQRPLDQAEAENEARRKHDREAYAQRPPDQAEAEREARRAHDAAARSAATSFWAFDPVCREFSEYREDCRKNPTGGGSDDENSSLRASFATWRSNVEPAATANPIKQQAFMRGHEPPREKGLHAPPRNFDEVDTAPWGAAKAIEATALFDFHAALRALSGNIGRCSRCARRGPGLEVATADGPPICGACSTHSLSSPCASRTF